LKLNSSQSEADISQRRKYPLISAATTRNGNNNNLEIVVADK